MDPYVALSVRSQEQKSNVATDDGSEPEWNETFVFTISGDAPELIIKLMDKDNFSADDFVGEATKSSSVVSSVKPGVNKFPLIPEFFKITNLASIWFISLFCLIFATGILEMRWSGVGIDEWWRNEQFWVIGGVSAHLFVAFQGLLKVLAGIDTNYTVTSMASDEEGEFSELNMFKWTTL
ncbi:hypothetical protein Droror1_Dr00017855 [Drosera rotundifolia]